MNVTLLRGLIWILTVPFAFASPLVDQVQRLLPAGTTSNVLFSNDGAEAFTRGGDDGVTSKYVDVEAGVPFQKALRVTVTRTLTPAWSALALSPAIKSNVPRDHVLFVSFWTRAPQMTGGKSGIVKAYFEKAAPEWDSIAEASVNPNASWKQVHLFGRLAKDLPSEGIHLSIHLGQQEQTIDVGGLVVLDLGTRVDVSKLPQNKLIWPGMEPDAPWRAEAAKRIEALRRGTLNVRVADERGKPVPEAKVRVVQIRRDFTFGSYTGFGNGLLDQGELGQRYRSIFLKLFDRATVPLYWADWGWEDPNNRFEEIARWAKNANLAIRGHVLFYPGYRFMPAFTQGLGAKELQKLVLGQIQDVARTLPDIPFRELDVTNELRDLTEVPNLVGKEGVAEWFRQARKSFPRAKLALNENTILTDGGMTKENQENFLGWYRTLRSLGVAPDVLGFQGHFGESVTGPETIWKILDRFAEETTAEFQITEFDVNTYDEEGQAAYLRDFYTACFAHPRMKAITMWGFWEGDHWIPKAAEWRTDWTPKPAGKILEELLGKTWRTNESWKTNSEGKASGRIWLGELEVSVEVGGKTTKRVVTLTEPKQPGEVSIVLGKP